MTTIRELHQMTFGDRVAGYYDEAIELWNRAFGEMGDPPVLLVDDGGFAGYGRALADAGPHRVAGSHTQYVIRLFSNGHTQGRIGDAEFRRDLIAHELAHVYERHVLGRIGKARDGSTHDSKSWRTAISKATRYVLPEVAAEADAAGVTLDAVFSTKASRVVWDREAKQSIRVRVAGLGPDVLQHWPDIFRTPEGRAAWRAAYNAVTQFRDSRDGLETIDVDARPRDTSIRDRVSLPSLNAATAK
jgi:hypothetical protein